MSGDAVYRIGEDSFSADQLALMGAESPDLFYRLFFPKTMRQGSAAFHLELDAALEDPSKRFVAAKMFRGSAKTTRLRMYCGRRVAYGLSHTILWIGPSEGAIARSVRWLRRHVERNHIYAGVFSLGAGLKWGETELEIVNKATGEVTWVLGVGMTGSLRGINFDDYRPDLILLDDVLDDENTATKEQRDKNTDLLYGAVMGSLTPSTEDPNAKMVMLQTPFHLEDALAVAEKDPRVYAMSIPIWTKASVDLPIDRQVSVWEERLPTETIRADKRAAAAINKVSGWIREYEVRLTSPETRAFKPGWLQPIDIMPQYTANILAIDPVPPPSDIQVAKGLAGKDFEALAVVGRRGEDYYVREIISNTGHEPNWTVNEFFRLMIKWKCLKCVIHAVNYEKTLKWILEQEMRRRGIYFVVEALAGDKRPKYHKIVSTLSGIGSQGHLFCHTSHTNLISQFTDYPSVSHDDELDAVAIGMSRLINPVMEMGSEEYGAVYADRDMKIPMLKGHP